MKPGLPVRELGGSMKVPPNSVRKAARSLNPGISAPLPFTGRSAAYFSYRFVSSSEFGSFCDPFLRVARSIDPKTDFVFVDDLLEPLLDPFQ